MQIKPRPEKLASTKIPPEELQTAFETALLSAASVDCGTVMDPMLGHAEFGESLAANLAIARKIQPEMAKTYAVILEVFRSSCAEALENNDSFPELEE